MKVIYLNQYNGKLRTMTLQIASDTLTELARWARELSGSRIKSSSSKRNIGQHLFCLLKYEGGQQLKVYCADARLRAEKKVPVSGSSECWDALLEVSRIDSFKHLDGGRLMVTKNKRHLQMEKDSLIIRLPCYIQSKHQNISMPQLKTSDQHAYTISSRIFVQALSFITKTVMNKKTVFGVCLFEDGHFIANSASVHRVAEIKPISFPFNLRIQDARKIRRWLSLLQTEFNNDFEIMISKHKDKCNNNWFVITDEYRNHTITLPACSSITSRQTIDRIRSDIHMIQIHVDLKKIRLACRCAAKLSVGQLIHIELLQMREDQGIVLVQESPPDEKGITATIPVNFKHTHFLANCSFVIGAELLNNALNSFSESQVLFIIKPGCAYLRIKTISPEANNSIIQEAILKVHSWIKDNNRQLIAAQTIEAPIESIFF